MTSAFWKGRSVFVTGHTGFKGAWLAAWLARRGAKVTGYALAPETTPNLCDIMADAGVTSVIGDIRDARALSDCMARARPDVVFHLAAQALVRRSYRDPVETYSTNVMGTVHVLEAIRATPSVEAAVVVTSDKCYENLGSIWGYRENEPMGGHDPYSSSKGCAEHVVSAYRHSFFNGSGHPCKIASGRAGNVIGGGDWSEDRLIPDVIRSIARHQSVEIRSPKATRPWQHVLEPLNGYIVLAEHLCGRDGRDYAEGWNFGPVDEDCMPVDQVVGRFVKLWGPPAAWHLSTVTHPHEAHFLKVDASKAKARLGWHPKLRLAEALDWTATWYRGHLSAKDPAALTYEQIETYEDMAPSGVF
jgi:CDP-glucose 4,6-dehydratase